MDASAAKLIDWFDLNKRDLPWRKNNSPYHIWVSEVMLQQTQVIQVIPYYKNFIRQFPDIRDLAFADPDRVLKVWEGMGYYNRVRNMQRAAKIMVDQHNGQIPEERSTLIKLPGFGPYITNAVLSLAYDQAYAVKDGNVMRVIARLYGIADDLRQTTTQTRIDQLVHDLLDHDQPGKFNEALMELGATICLPRSPKCDICPLNQLCRARIKNITDRLPFKSRTPARPERTAYGVILIYGENVLIAQRPHKGLLGGLWEFPEVITTQNSDQMDTSKIQDQFHIKGRLGRSFQPVKHTYTHFSLKLIPVMFRVATTSFYSEFYVKSAWVEWKELEKYPMHRAMHKAVTLVSDRMNAEFKSHNPATGI